MSASFWKLFGIGVVSAIDTLLNKEDCTLEQLFLEDELLNECKYGNKTLLAFILRPSSLEALFRFLTSPLPDSADPKIQRFPHIASEILCTEGFWEHLCPPLFDENPQLITHLWSYFLAEEVTRANVSAVSKVVSTFFERLPLKSFELLPKDDIIDALLNLCDHASVVELLLKIDIASQNPEYTPLKEWLDSTALLNKLLKKLDSRYTPALVSETVSEALQEQLARADAAQMISRLQHPANFQILLDFVLNRDSAIVELLPVVSLIITLLRHDALETYDDQTARADIPSYLDQLLEGTARFTELLVADAGSPFVLAHGRTITPVGGSKLKIIELLHTLVSLRRRAVVVHLIESGLLKTCLDIFFAQPWNNFLHKFVVDIMLAIIGNADHPLLVSFLKSTSFLEQVGAAAKENEADLEAPKHIQRGYMGHIAVIAEALLREAQQNAELLDMFHQSEPFIFYLNRTLYPTQKRQFCWQTLAGLPEKYVLFHSEFHSSINESLLRDDLLLEPVVIFATVPQDALHDAYDVDAQIHPEDNSNSDSNSSGEEEMEQNHISSDEELDHDIQVESTPELDETPISISDETADN